MLLRASRVATAIPRTRFLVFLPLALLVGAGLLMLTSSASASGPAGHSAKAAPAVTNNHPDLSLRPNSIALTSTPTITCTVVPGTTDTGNHCDDCDTSVTLPFPVTLYGRAHSSVNVSSNGRLDFARVNDPGGFANSCLPASPNPGPYDFTVFPYWDDLRTDCAGCGVFTALRGAAPNRTFIIEWRTNYRAGGTANFEVLLNEGPPGVDIIYGRVDGHGNSATVGVQGPNNLYTQYACNSGGIYEGLCLHLPFSPPPVQTSTPTGTPTHLASPTCGANYLYATATATIAPGATDTGNHCDDCTTPITLPFSFRLYDLDFTTAGVSSNGYLQFGNSRFDGKPGRVAGSCPPPGVTYTILPYREDLRTDQMGACTSFPGGCGIFTSVSGSAPNRIFNVEWRVIYFGAPTQTANFEVRLYENAPGQQFDFVYGRLDMCCAMVGVVKDGASYSCYTGSESRGLKITWTLPPCATATATRTCTAMPMSTSTSTPCSISFTDVQPTDYFYEPVRHLYCRGAISGYGDDTFRPYNSTTRAQACKIVVLAYGFVTYIPPTPVFDDVPMSDPFFMYIFTANHFGLVTGYRCGTNCLVFRPGNHVTRAQLSKIIVLAAGWPIYTPPMPSFDDVTPDNPFYGFIETAYYHQIISGYLDRIFRPGNNATRGQICKIVSLAVTHR